MSGDATFVASLDGETRTIRLFMSLLPEVADGLAAVREQVYVECRTRAEATALVDEVLRQAGMDGYEIQTCSLSVPTDRAEESSATWKNGCWVYSGLGWTGDGKRQFFISGK